MHFVLQSGNQSLLSLGADELLAITNALNEVCNSIAISESEFQTRLGIERKFAANLLKALSGTDRSSRQGYEVVQVWADQSSVMVRAITAFGDPVELGENEVAEFATQLQTAINEAS